MDEKKQNVPTEAHLLGCWLFKESSRYGKYLNAWRSTAWKVSKYGGFFGCVYSCIRTRTNSVFGHFLRSDLLHHCLFTILVRHQNYVKQQKVNYLNTCINFHCHKHSFKYIQNFWWIVVIASEIAASLHSVWWHIRLCYLEVWYSIKKRLQHSCFTVNIAKFLGTPFYRIPSLAASEAGSVRTNFFIEHLRWVLLKLVQ